MTIMEVKVITHEMQLCTLEKHCAVLRSLTKGHKLRDKQVGFGLTHIPMNAFNCRRECLLPDSKKAL